MRHTPNLTISPEKADEVEEFIATTGILGVDYRIVVQHFCFEAWALGNRRIGARNPKNPTLVAYRAAYDVSKRDPEGLPANTREGLNRSQFAEKYLRLTLNDKNRRLTYSKSNPHVVAHPMYFHRLKERLKETEHIGSFNGFLQAFQ